MDPSLMIPSYFGGYGPPARFRQRNNAVDAKNYDFRAQRTSLTTTNNILESMVHMQMCGAVATLVVVHAVYAEAGLWTSLSLNIFLVVLCGYCSCSLVWSAQKLYGRVQMATLTYPDVIEACVLLSPWQKFRKSARAFRYLLEIGIVVHRYGWCSACWIMISRNLKELVEGDDLIGDGGIPPLPVYILALTGPGIVFVMVTNLKTIAPFAVLCSIYPLGVLLLTLWYGLRTDSSPLDRAPFKTPMGLFETICSFTFLFETQSYALAVENNMEEPKKFHFVMIGSSAVVGAISLITGFIGYWRYGETCRAPITIHFPFNAYPIIMKVMLCWTLYLPYMLSFYIAFDVEWFYLKRNHAAPNHWFWERLYRTFHVGIVVLICYFFPNVTRQMGFFGGLSSSTIIFIYPAFIEMLVDWEYPGMGRFKWRLIKIIPLFMVGTTVFTAGTFYSTYGLYNETFLYKREAMNISGSLNLL